MTPARPSYRRSAPADQNLADCLSPAGCAFYFGYHGAAFSDRRPGAVNTFVYSSYVDYGDAVPAQDDVHERVLSHELLEWVDDPFVHGARVQGMPTFFANAVPPWRSPFDAGGALCGPILEVADPLEGGGSVFTAPLVVAHPPGGALTYLLADAAFVSWFARQSPSTAVDGRYDAAGVLDGYSTRC